MEQVQGEKKGRKTIIVVAVAAVVLLAVVLAVLKLSGGSGSATMKRVEKLGVGYFMALTEEEVVAALGEPVERSETDGSKNLNVNLTYGTEEQADIVIHLFSRDAEEKPATVDWIVFKSARTSVLGITPGVSSAADARQSLDKRGVYYVENDFDLNYYGIRNVMQEDERWFVTYQEDDLSYLITYDAEGEQTVRDIRVYRRPKRDNPGGMFTCTQLTQRLNGQDPTVLLGMTEAQVESQFGFCGDFLDLAKDFYTNESACRINIDHGNGTGRYTTIRLEGPGFAVQGIEVGVTTLAEADAILSAAGAREFTREAGEGVLRGTPYQELDLEALENIPLQEYERVYLTDGWYAELQFQDQILSAAKFTALEQPIDLTPPAPKERYNEAELMAAYESAYREKYLYSGSATLLADLTHDGIPELLVMSDQGGEGNRKLDVYAAPKGTPKRIYSAGVSYVDSSSGYYRLYSEDGLDYLFHGFNEHSIGQPAGDIVYSLTEDGGVKTFRTGFNPDGDSRISDIVKNSTALISPDTRYTGNVFAATAQAAGDRFTVHGISFHIELPQQFKDLCTIVETEDCVEFYYAREYKGPNIGFLFDIGYYASPDDYMEWSSVLAEVPGGQLVATFPSDVQFDGMDKVSSKEYPMLQGQVSNILKTVTVQ